MIIPHDSVEIVEVGPRDGLQNLREFVKTEHKVALIQRLAKSGLREIQIGSFVNPLAVPQFRDIKKIADQVVGNLPGITFTALVPNLKGAEEAFSCGIRKIAFVLSVSRGHSLSNVQKTPEESLEELKDISRLRSDHPDAVITVDLATAFGCCFQLKVTLEDVLHYVGEVHELGFDRVTLCDTVGFGNPRQVYDFTTACIESFPEVVFRCHLHNTRGLGLAGTLAAYMAGIRSFDSSIGGLGGCPFAPGATGNIATEDEVFMFNEMGVKTGVDVESLIDTTRYLSEIMPGINLESALLRAGLPAARPYNGG
ncbi:MAG: hydroxymethylglutaryl-CoA lyase [Deltaproteobacteria bacterium]|nr:hydroxymethylglutaryl-CoA lyase [Deltaproteobacteria bacterium]MBW2596096.1 hydroxymethylglutaryl-CoA lyase [Deltaproteobacteria bacterium]MBW2650854.1 hydroxymethylglutaryl-CoA lyase [Deltaproteobacteria bacterium]